MCTQTKFAYIKQLLSSMCFWIILRMTFSNNLHIVDRRLVGRKFLRNFGSLPGFGNVMTFAPLQDFGKWDSRKQWLNKCVKCANGLILSWGLVVYGFEQSLNYSIHPPFIVRVAQVMVCGLIFQAVNNCFGFLGLMKFKAWRTMNSSWCPWFIPLLEAK
jgi:hypothetical protein